MHACIAVFRGNDRFPNPIVNLNILVQNDGAERLFFYQILSFHAKKKASNKSNY